MHITHGCWGSEASRDLYKVKQKMRPSTASQQKLYDVTAAAADSGVMMRMSLLGFVLCTD